MGGTHVRFSAEDRRAQIIETATELFAQRGFEGTTTREIAEKARVNEAIIFRHFPSKEELYWAVIDRQCCLSKGKSQLEMELASEKGVREVLLNVAEDFLRRREEDDKLPRLLFYTALENHRLSSRFFQTHIQIFYETLAAFLRKQIDKGEFRRVDPVMAARGFFGMLIYHYMVQDLFGGKRFQKINAQTAAETIVDLFLSGVSSSPLKCAVSGQSLGKNPDSAQKSEK